MTSIQILPMTPSRRMEAARVLASAFVSNPLHVAAFGGSDLHANEAFFRTGLAAMKGSKLVAVEGERVIGALHWVQYPGCRYSGLAKLRMVPAMVRGLGLRSALKVVSWVSAWAKCDPDESHLHLGPIGVDPQAQGRKIGRLLMERYCAELDATGAAGYLETDRPANVGFYERFGFRTTGTQAILGIENFFMRREPRFVAASPG